MKAWFCRWLGILRTTGKCWLQYGRQERQYQRTSGKKVALKLFTERTDSQQTIDLTEDDLVFITNGCCTDTSCYGDQILLLTLVTSEV